ncbi:FtsB family cell division protein [Cellulomonas chitinilytica]|nr:septum formation initiator family protein [Cellulomonas chitinilytica]
MPRLFSVRVLVFSLVVLLAFILVSPTLHSYLQQRQDLEDLRREVAAAQARNDDLRADLLRWDDSAYVIAQARERLSFVMPGEMAFRVKDPETVPDTPATTSGPAATVQGEDVTRPWYATVWDSVQIAGKTPAGTAPDAATTPPATSPETPDPGPSGG